MVAGSESFLYSEEGVTQGDPLSMFLYTCTASTLPLTSALKGGGRIESALATELLPVIMRCKVSDDERTLFALPPRVGGLGIFNLIKRCDLSYTSSRKCCKEIGKAIRGY